MQAKTQFVVIVSCVDKENVSSSVILFPSFKEALEYAQADATYYKHLASTYTEKVGDNKLHARITLKGKYINKTYYIHDLGYDKERNVMNTHLNTYSSWDYIDGIAI